MSKYSNQQFGNVSIHSKQHKSQNRFSHYNVDVHLSNPTLIVVAAFCCAYLATSNPQILKVVVGRCLVGCCAAIRIRTQHTLVCLVHQAIAASWQSNSRYGKMWTRQGSRTLMINESKNLQLFTCCTDLWRDVLIVGRSTFTCVDDSDELPTSWSICQVLIKFTNCWPREDEIVWPDRMIIFCRFTFYIATW